ncbi:MAG: AEC family transporter [Sutterella wadsworthensis]
MGLLCIGAGLRLHDFRDHLALITTSVVCRLLAVPAIAWGAVTLAGLDPVEAGVAILFAALPTAQSCYVMTASMKGDAPSVANVTTAQTLAAMATLPSGSRRSSSASRPSRAETGIRERQMHERPQDRVSLRASHCSIRDEVRPTRGVARASEEACGGSILPSRRRPGARGTCGLRRA